MWTGWRYQQSLEAFIEILSINNSLCSLKLHKISFEYSVRKSVTPS